MLLRLWHWNTVCRVHACYIIYIVLQWLFSYISNSFGCYWDCGYIMQFAGCMLHNVVPCSPVVIALFNSFSCYWGCGNATHFVAYMLHNIPCSLARINDKTSVIISHIRSYHWSFHASEIILIWQMYYSLFGI